MKSSKWLPLAIVLIGIAVIAVFLPKRPPAATQTAAPAMPPPAGLEEVASAPDRAQPAAPAEVEESATLLVEPQGEEPAPAPRNMLVRLDMVLAEVNGVELTLKDLMPVGPAMDPEQSLDPALFQSLLQRAIERVLTFQAARQRRVDLTDEQRRQLEKMRARAMVEKPELAAERDGEYEAQANFDTWEASARMMQDSLFAASGGLASFVTQDQVDEYYQEHRAEFDTLPEDPDARREAKRKIDTAIRLLLAPREDPKYQWQLQLMIEELMAKANIKKHSPGE